MEHTRLLSSLLLESSADIGVLLSTEQVQQFIVYLKQLQLWNKSFNLTNITQDEEIIIKHFVDSLAALKAENMKIGARLLDIGTGAGFPGIPLKIAKWDLHLTLIEPAQKKTSFLRFIIGRLKLEDIAIFDGTLERFLSERLSDGLFDYVTTRALKHDMILEYGKKLLRQGGKVILYSSQPVTSFYLSQNWLLSSQYDFQLPKGYGQRVISTIRPSF